MEFQIVSCKGNETFTSTLSAALWLIELQPMTADVVVRNVRCEIKCAEGDTWENCYRVRVNVETARDQAMAEAEASAQTL